MNYLITISMDYVGLGANPDGTVTSVCNADMSNITFISNNEGGGRREDSITGNLIISDEYNDFGLYLNDETGYFVDPDYFSWTLSFNGEVLNTNKLKLIRNNIDSSKLTLKAYDLCDNEYTNIINNLDVEYDIVADSGIGTTIRIDYLDVRTVITQTTYDTFYYYSGQSFLDYMNEKLEEDDTWLPYRFVFDLPTGTYPFTVNVEVKWKKFISQGFYDGTIRVPPCGIDWVYSSDVYGYPVYSKKPRYSVIGDPQVGVNIIYLVTHEGLADITYVSVGRKLQDVIEYLIDKADSTIAISGSFNGFQIDGESFGGDTKFMEITQLITMSDFIPAPDNDQKNVKATKGFISLGTIFTKLKEWGFYWYLEESGGTYTFKLEHPMTKSLGSSNPNLSNYLGRDWTKQTKNISIKEDDFDKIKNSTTSSTYEHSLPEYKYRSGTKTKSFSDNNIYTDLDYIIDAKTQAFDDTVTNQWVLCSTKLTPGGRDIRYFASAYNTNVYVNNLEMSFDWLSKNIMTMPGKIGDDSTEFDDERLELRKEIELEIPIENPQTDFSFYDTVSIHGKDAEIQRIEKKALESIGKIKLKYL